jgi:hypothetical protein
MFLCVYICLFVCSCLYSLCAANRSRFVSELRGIDGQALATKWFSSSSSTRLKILSICLVKASVLWPIMSHLLYNSLSHILWTIKELTSFLFTLSLITFWVTMVSFMLALYFNQWTWWDTMMILWFYSGYDDILMAFKGTRAVSRVPLRKDWFVGWPLLGTCSQMLWVKNKATQKMSSIKVLRPSKHYFPW